MMAKFLQDVAKAPLFCGHMVDCRPLTIPEWRELCAIRANRGRSPVRSSQFDCRCDF
jgi:hypothetical protein